MAARTTSTVAKILSYQILIIAIVSLGFATRGWQQAYSSLLGGLAAFVPNAYFALRITSSARQEARKIMNSFYQGEFIKLILTAVMFVLILQIPDIRILPLFASYAVALMVFWFALLMR